MKKLLMLGVVYSLFCAQINAQAVKETEPEVEIEKGFKKENLFTGGTVGLGLGSGSFSLGLGPYFGYSINKYIDLAVGLNYNYISQRDYYSTLKIRQSIIGPTAFTRIYPVKFLFAQAQYEYNFIKYKEIYGNGFPDKVAKIKVPSFLIGPGFASGRDADNKTFYYISVLFDVLKNINSPYVDNLGRVNPIIRAGVNVALFQGEGGGFNNGRRSQQQQQRRRF